MIIGKASYNNPATIVCDHCGEQRPLVELRDDWYVGLPKEPKEKAPADKQLVNFCSKECLEDWKKKNDDGKDYALTVGDYKKAMDEFESARKDM